MTNLTNPIFHDEDKARKHFEALRWPQGPVCPHCGSVDNATAMAGETTRPGLYKCREKECALTSLKKEFEDKKAARNTIAHATFAGTLKAEPKTAVFSPIRTGDGAGQLQIVFIPTGHMVECLTWASRAADAVIEIYEKLEGPIERLDE